MDTQAANSINIQRRLQPNLQEISVRNFKAFGNELQVAPLSRITLIYGPNSGGKSSLIQCLLLLKQSESESRVPAVLAPRGDYVDLAGFRSMVHRHDENRELEIAIKAINKSRRTSREHLNFGLTFRNGNGPLADIPILDSIDLAVKFSDQSKLAINLRRTAEESPEEWDDPDFVWGDSESSIQSYAQFLGSLFHRDVSQSPLDFAARMAQDQYSHLAPLFVSNSDFQSNILEMLRHTNFYAYRSILPAYIDLDNFQSEGTSADIQEVLRFIDNSDRELDGIMRDFRNLLDEIAYLGPILDNPQRIFTGSGVRRHSVGKRGEYTFDIISTDNQVQNAINEWLLRLEIPCRIYGIENQLSSVLTGVLGLIVLEDIRTGTLVTPVDVGYGISQILPVIVEGIAGSSDVICVDQPEVHLHSKLQAEIADLMIETLPRKQWIVETHSELLLRRIQRRIAEEQNKVPEERKIVSADVSVLYIDPENASEGEGSKILLMELAENGDLISDWPKGFFEEGYHEMMAKLFAGGNP